MEEAVERGIAAFTEAERAAGEYRGSISSATKTGERLATLVKSSVCNLPAGSA